MFVPLHEEMSYAYDRLIEAGAEPDIAYSKTQSQYDFTFELLNRSKILVGLTVIGDMGNLRASVKVVKALLNTDPHSIYLVGIAGSLNSEVARLGDVVISTRVKTIYPDKVKKLNPEKETFVSALSRGALKASVSAAALEDRIAVDDRKKLMNDSFLRYRRDALKLDDSSRKVSAYLRHLASTSYPALAPVLASGIDGLKPQYDNDKPTVTRGDVFGSDMVIDSAEYIDFLHLRNDEVDLEYYAQKAALEDPSSAFDKRNPDNWFPEQAVIVDMETYGFFMTLNTVMKNYLAFSVRGVSDLASEKENLDSTTFDAVRRVAVRNAIDVVIDMIRQIPAPLGRL